MDGIGERLRKRREELGLTVDDVAETTKFRPEIIRSIEEGRWSVFAADVYQDAFLATYAKVLGLDARRLVLDEKGEEERAQEAIRLIGQEPKVAASRRWLFVLSGLIGICAVFAVLLFGTSVFDRRIAEGPAGQASGEPQAGAGEPAVTGERKIIEVAPDSARLNAGASRRDAGQVSGPEAGGAAKPGQEAPGVRTIAGVDSSRPDSAARGERPGGDLAAVGAGRNEHTLEIRAAGVVFLRLISGADTLVDEYMSPGETRKFTSAEPFMIESMLYVSNASLVLDGKPVVLPDSGSRDVYGLVLPQTTGRR